MDYFKIKLRNYIVVRIVVYKFTAWLSQWRPKQISTEVIVVTNYEMVSYDDTAPDGRRLCKRDDYDFCEGL